MLAASAAALPALLATAGCRSSDAFAGPDPLAGRLALSPDVITLQEVITAERAMIALYQAAMNGGTRPARALEGLLAQHRQHLGRLQARLVLPSGSGPLRLRLRLRFHAPGPGRVTIAQLRAAERASATDLVRRLVSVPPALAQLFASIAASDATHVVALAGYGQGWAMTMGAVTGPLGGAGLAGRAGGRGRGHLRLRGGGRPPVRDPQDGRRAGLDRAQRGPRHADRDDLRARRDPGRGAGLLPVAVRRDTTPPRRPGWRPTWRTG